MSGFTVSGGGSVEVDTAPMLAAAAALDHVGEDLRVVLQGLAAAGGVAGPAAAAVRTVEDRARAALGSAGRAAAGLRLAGFRYGVAEDGVHRTVESAAAANAALAGGAVRLVTPFVPGLPLGMLAASAAAAGEALLIAAGVQALTVGGVAPQLDPQVLAGVRAALASADDAVRGLVGLETPAEVVGDDPGAPLGAEALAGLAATVLPATTDRVTVTRVFRPLPSPPPASLGELADRVPPAGAAEPQVRVERYEGAGTRRWIVYVTGTVSFAPGASGEPFDLRSDLLGVADRPSASESAVRAAMAASGVRPDEPVLLVGHSQGALDAVRIAEHGGYRVAGVITLGGPTGQIPLPPSIPVLALEHVEDPVPVLGGAVAGGAAGRARIVVRRQLYSRAEPPPSTGVPSHAVERYAETLHQVERSPEPRLAAFRRSVAPFLHGRNGIATDYLAVRAPEPARAEERARVRPSPAPRAAAARER